jgi:hypothetical protein
MLYPLDLNSFFLYFFAWCSHWQGGLACEVCIKCKQRAETWERRRASQAGSGSRFSSWERPEAARFRSAALKRASEMRHSSDVSRAAATRANTNSAVCSFLVAVWVFSCKFYSLCAWRDEFQKLSTPDSTTNSSPREGAKKTYIKICYHLVMLRICMGNSIVLISVPHNPQGCEVRLARDRAWDEFKYHPWSALIWQMPRAKLL